MFKRHYEPPPLVSGYPLDGALDLVVPVNTDVTNLCANPSFETNTGGWAVSGTGTIARTTTKQRRGVASLLVTPASTFAAGTYYDGAGGFTLTLGTTYSIGIDFWGAPGVAYRVTVSDASLNYGYTDMVGKGYWERITFIYPEITSSAARRLYVTKFTVAGKGVQNSVEPFYVDGVLVAALPYRLKYFDGDTTGYTPLRQEYYWTGVPHASTSVMRAQTRSGGKLVSLTEYGFVLLAMLGMGMQPVDNLSQRMALTGGALFQRTVKLVRVFDLVGYISAENRSQLERYIAQLAYDLEPSRVPYSQPVVFQYTPMDDCGNGVGNLVNIPCLYSGGLEGSRDNNYRINLDMKFEMFLPYIASLDGSAGSDLAVFNTFTANKIVQRSSGGVWSGLGTGVAAGATQVRATVYKNGILYVGGSFTLMGGVANTVRIAKWDGVVWTAMGTGASTEAVFALAAGSDGYVYAGGSFDQMGGIANTNGIARYNISTGVWSAMGTGAAAAGIVYAMVIGTDGKLYAFGDFTGMGGVANTVNAAVWDGAAWASITPAGAANGTIWSATLGPDGLIYVGGAFTLINALAANRVVKYDPSTGTWTQLGSGVAAGIIYALAFDSNGYLFAGGSSAAGMLRVSNGLYWWSIGTLTGIDVRSLLFNPFDQTMYIGGNITDVDGVPFADGLVAWTGGAFSAVDVDLPSQPGVWTIGLDSSSGNLVFGFDTTGTATASGALTTVVNAGSTDAFPIIVINQPVATVGTSIIYQIKNNTTDEILNLSLPVSNGETIRIDLTPGRKTIVSDVSGNAIGRLLPGSNLSTFHLQPGTNNIFIYAALVSGSGVATGTIQWVPNYTALESVVR